MDLTPDEVMTNSFEVKEGLVVECLDDLSVFVFSYENGSTTCLNPRVGQVFKIIQQSVCVSITKLTELTGATMSDVASLGEDIKFLQKARLIECH